MADDNAFADLRRLADALAALETRTLRAAARRAISQLATKLDTLAVPLLVRTLSGSTPIAREAARDTLAALATQLSARDRILDALRELITSPPTSDDAKVCVLGLLAELGVPDTATFSDPAAIQRRSALALAAQLETPSDVANAADMMVKKLEDRDVVQMVEALLQVSPAAAHRLGGELALRLDVGREQRAKIAAVLDAQPAPVESSTRSTRPTHVAVLVDAAARIVVVATRKHGGERTWRRWAVLIGEAGAIEDCLHEDAAPDGALDPTASLIANLCADGYRVASSELDHAQTLVATAARRTARASGVLVSGYYLGRDLLDLRDAHMVAEPVEPLALAKAIDLLAGGDALGARALFERCPSDVAMSSDWAGGYGACLLALGEPAAAVPTLERAITIEPSWPLHHWNLAAALHQLRDLRGCQSALRRFLTTSAQRSALVEDLDQPARVTHARQLVAELERIARIDRGARRRTTSSAKKRKKPAR